MSDTGHNETLAKLEATIAERRAADPASFYVAKLNADMTSLGERQTITGLTDFREGLFMNKRNGLYHLTYSIDDTGSDNYRVG